MNVNLPTDLQRLAPLLAVAVLAVVGLFLVTRGLGGDEATVPPNPAPAKSSPAKPGTPKATPSKGGSAQSGTPQSGSGVKPSKKAYVSCVQQATDAPALEKCQALVP
jgi:hypothetical protein